MLNSIKPAYLLDGEFSDIKKAYEDIDVLLSLMIRKLITFENKKKNSEQHDTFSLVSERLTTAFCLKNQNKNHTYKSYHSLAIRTAFQLIKANIRNQLDDIKNKIDFLIFKYGGSNVSIQDDSDFIVINAKFQNIWATIQYLSLLHESIIEIFSREEMIVTQLIKKDHSNRNLMISPTHDNVTLSKLHLVKVQHAFKTNQSYINKSQKNGCRPVSKKIIDQHYRKLNQTLKHLEKKKQDLFINLSSSVELNKVFDLSQEESARIEKIKIRLKASSMRKGNANSDSDLKSFEKDQSENTVIFICNDNDRLFCLPQRKEASAQKKGYSSHKTIDSPNKRSTKKHVKIRFHNNVKSVYRFFNSLAKVTFCCQINRSEVYDLVPRTLSAITIDNARHSTNKQYSQNLKP